MLDHFIPDEILNTSDWLEIPLFVDQLIETSEEATVHGITESNQFRHPRSPEIGMQVLFSTIRGR